MGSVSDLLHDGTEGEEPRFRRVEAASEDTSDAEAPVAHGDPVRVLKDLAAKRAAAGDAAGAQVALSAAREEERGRRWWVNAVAGLLLVAAYVYLALGGTTQAIAALPLGLGGVALMLNAAGVSDEYIVGIVTAIRGPKRDQEEDS